LFLHPGRVTRRSTCCLTCGRDLEEGDAVRRMDGVGDPLFIDATCKPVGRCTEPDISFGDPLAYVAPEYVSEFEPWIAQEPGWAERMLAAIPTMSHDDLFKLASIPMALPPEGMRTIDYRARWEARRVLHARGRWRDLEPRPPGGSYESIAMLHGLVPDGMIDNDGVPFAFKDNNEPHVHTPFCERMALSVEDGIVIWSLGGNDEEDDG
jgi:hypothetical protein